MRPAGFGEGLGAVSGAYRKNNAGAIEAPFDIGPGTLNGAETFQRTLGMDAARASNLCDCLAKAFEIEEVNLVSMSRKVEGERTTTRSSTAIFIGTSKRDRFRSQPSADRLESKTKLPPPRLRRPIRSLKPAPSQRLRL